ncbi:MAG: hypothetical protein IPN96_15935 [Anaerolineales bacterium]|nr:hypothetical protein [Anaerolineales bacterium]
MILQFQRRINRSAENKSIHGCDGSLIFAAQMINAFPVAGGTSGHRWVGNGR